MAHRRENKFAYRRKDHNAPRRSICNIYCVTTLSHKCTKTSKMLLHILNYSIGLKNSHYQSLALLESDPSNERIVVLIDVLLAKKPATGMAQQWLFQG